MADAGADQYTFHLEATGKSNSAPHCGLWHSWGFIKGVIFVSTGCSSANIQLTCGKQSEKSQQQFATRHWEHGSMWEPAASYFYQLKFHQQTKTWCSCPEKFWRCTGQKSWLSLLTSLLKVFLSYFFKMKTHGCDMQAVSLLTGNLDFVSSTM